MFADDIEQKIGLPIINIITSTANAAKSQGVKKVGLLGTKFTMEMDFYRKKLEAEGLDVIIPKKQETRNEIQRIVKEELGKGEIKESSKKTFISIINELIEDRAEGIILGCTEIPMLVSHEDFSTPIFDTTKIHSEAVVKFILG